MIETPPRTFLRVISGGTEMWVRLACLPGKRELPDTRASHPASRSQVPVCLSLPLISSSTLMASMTFKLSLDVNDVTVSRDLVASHSIFCHLMSPYFLTCYLTVPPANNPNRDPWSSHSIHWVSDQLTHTETLVTECFPQ